MVVRRADADRPLESPVILAGARCAQVGGSDPVALTWQAALSGEVLGGLSGGRMSGSPWMRWFPMERC
jgi:hypothetical protein